MVAYTIVSSSRTFLYTFIYHLSFRTCKYLYTQIFVFYTYNFYFLFMLSLFLFFSYRMNNYRLVEIETIIEK